MRFLYNNNEVVTEKHYIKIFNNHTEFIILKTLKSGYECKTNKVTDEEEKERICRSRIKSKIRDYSLMNDFEFFYTQTISNKYNRYDLDNFKTLILKKFKAYKRINKDFIYLIIFEKHKDGAFHLHGLIGGVGVDLHKNSYGYDTLEFFNDIGFNSISRIKSKEKISNYIIKYVSKDFCKCSTGYSYFHSKGLKLPSIKEIYIDDFSNLVCFYENNYLKKFKIKC